MAKRSAPATIVVSGALAAMLTACSGPTEVANTARPPTRPQPTRQPANTPTSEESVTRIDDLLAPGAALELLIDGVGFTEGPLWLPDGRLIFSRMSDDSVAALGADGALTDYLRPSGIANGHAFDWTGRILQAEHAGRITRLELDGSVTVLAESYDGRRLNSPNDLVVRSDGVIFFTDPSFGLNGRDSELGFQGVFRLDPASQDLRVLTRDLPMPNGIGLSPDEQTLYVSDTTLGQVFAFSLTEDDKLGERQPVGAGIDGLLVDDAGRIWSTASDGVHVLTPTGQDLGTLGLAQGATNVALGGSTGQTLFVTTSTGLYRVETRVVEAAPGH